MIKQLGCKISMLCLSACLVSVVQAEDTVTGLTLANQPELYDMACHHPSIELETREVAYVFQNNGEQSVSLGQIYVESRDQYADSLVTVLMDEAEDCTSALAPGKTCNVRLEIAPPQCPINPETGKYMPIKDDVLDRTLKVGSLDIPVRPRLNYLGVAAYYTMLSGAGGIFNVASTAQVLGNVGISNRGELEGPFRIIGTRPDQTRLLAAWAQWDLSNAIATLRDEGQGCEVIPGNLGSEGEVRSVVPGYYCPQDRRLDFVEEFPGNPDLPANPFPIFNEVTLEGKFTFNGNNDPYGVFVFLIDGSFTVSKSTIDFINGASAGRVFWIVTSGGFIPDGAQQNNRDPYFRSCGGGDKAEISFGAGATLCPEARLQGNLIVQNQLLEAVPAADKIAFSAGILMDVNASLYGRALVSNRDNQNTQIVMNGNSVTGPFVF